MENCIIKALEADELEPAISLTIDTFMEFEAPVYSQAGIESFKRYLYGGEIQRKYKTGEFIMWSCCNEKMLLGIMGMRDYSHISLAFTHRDFHRQGVGRMLFNTLVEYVRNNSDANKITVNSSPYGIPFYHKIGFIDTDMERIDDGIRYTPMEYILER